MAQQIKTTSKYSVMKVIPSPICPCGEAEQDTTNILQTCKNNQALRQQIWPSSTTIQEKLYGTVDVLQKTTKSVEEAQIQEEEIIIPIQPIKFKTADLAVTTSLPTSMESSRKIGYVQEHFLKII